MVIIQALIAAVMRSAGRLLNTAFGWATVMLFGKVPQDRQLYLSGIAFGSVLWIIALIGVIVPSFASFLIAVVTVPSWIDRRWIRLGLLVAAIVLPAIVGWLSTRAVAAEHRPRGARVMALAVVKGYPYTLGLALTLVMMTAFAPILKLRNLARRWAAQHVPVIVNSDDYRDVVTDIQRALAAGGLPTERTQASWMLRLPTRVLSLFARRHTAALVAAELTRLASDRIEVLVHPSDVVVSGREDDVAHARAVLAERLTVTRAYLTWDKEANDVEDRIRAARDDLRRGARREAVRTLDAVADRLHTLQVPYEEWEVLFRELLLAERAARRGTAVAPSARRPGRVLATLLAAAPLLEHAADAVRDTARTLGTRRRRAA